MHRRDLLRAFGAATALSILPRDAFAAWSRVATGQFTSGLDASHLALVSAIGDTILPRTDTPSASDVGVPAFIDVYVAEYFTDAQRTAFLEGLDRIDDRARRFTGLTFAEASVAWRGEIITSIEADDRRTDLGRAYWRLKDLTVHGYFTSERVQRDVLKVEVMPGHFDGDVLIPARPTMAGESRND